MAATGDVDAHTSASPTHQQVALDFVDFSLAKRSNDPKSITGGLRFFLAALLLLSRLVSGA